HFPPPRRSNPQQSNPPQQPPAPRLGTRTPERLPSRPDPVAKIPHLPGNRYPLFFAGAGLLLFLSSPLSRPNFGSSFVPVILIAITLPPFFPAKNGSTAFRKNDFAPVVV